MKVTIKVRDLPRVTTPRETVFAYANDKKIFREYSSDAAADAPDHEHLVSLFTKRQHAVEAVGADLAAELKLGPGEMAVKIEDLTGFARRTIAAMNRSAAERNRPFRYVIGFEFPDEGDLAKNGKRVLDTLRYHVDYITKMLDGEPPCGYGGCMHLDPKHTHESAFVSNPGAITMVSE